MSIHDQIRETRTGYLMSDELAVCGLSVERDLQTDVVADFLGATARYERFFTPRNFIGVNELESREVRNQDSLRNVTASDAQRQLSDRVSSHLGEISVDIKGVGFIPLLRGDLLAIVDLEEDSQKTILEERWQVLEVLESFVPTAVYKWRRYERPGIPLGIVEVHNGPAERNEIRRVVNDVLPDRLTLAPAKYLPKRI